MSKRKSLVLFLQSTDSPHREVAALVSGEPSSGKAVRFAIHSHTG